MSDFVACQNVMYTKTPTDSETADEINKDTVDTTLNVDTVRISGRNEPYTKWTVCCETNVNTKVPKLLQEKRVTS